MPDLTDRERSLLNAVARGRNGRATAQDIASRLGYRPSRNGILAVTVMCRSINRKFPVAHVAELESGEAAYFNLGEYLCRIPPRDQWDNAVWCILKPGRAAIGEVENA